LASGKSVGVAQPTSPEQLARLIECAAQRGLRVCVRGAGLSQSGQSIPEDGLTLSTRGLREIDLLPDSVRCGAGVTWRELSERLAPFAKAPRVAPLNLDLTIGGTLSAGGFGATSHRHGLAVSNVRAVDVVLGDGRYVHATRSEASEVYNAVLGGAGQFGVIVTAELELRTIKPHVRTFFFSHERIEDMLATQTALAAKADYLEGFCAATVHGLRKGPHGGRLPFALWSYGVHASFEFDPAASESEPSVDVGSGAKLLHVEDEDTLAFAYRYDARFELMRATGAWAQTHPWFECLLPLSAAMELVPRILDSISVVLGDGHRLSVLAEHPVPSALALPSNGPHVAFAVLPMGIPAVQLDRTVQLLQKQHDAIVQAGGKRYVSGWLFRPTVNDWRTHFGAHYSELARAKRVLDPRGVFASTLFSSGIFEE
jgi:cytokinin dehydrogenase